CVRDSEYKDLDYW
nr:immunoglobulin heavy chain junction region [Macaca mulatta]MOV50648.1 immunoglobulin heavy chain junction region [Macaca mulatta]MOV52040.1 immunoglobulin heavy chain junction region [Macaca mulatta]MOV52154.1 immunoglobulin heavy chain junction region [Macaca mulatta]MOV52432.1 immunoglobulin heavy chain junction region [Macaca mulatta]